MKTEQEQMLKILCNKFQCSAIDTSYMAKSCRQCEDIIEVLHEAGYGDVSEYKAEIERLKAENDTNAQYIRMMGIQSHIKTSNERVKQGKIDILNELKEKCKFDGHTVAVYKNDIDELIEEVQNGKDKSRT